MKGYYYYERKRKVAPSFPVEKHDWGKYIQLILDHGVTVKDLCHQMGCCRLTMGKIRKGMTLPNHPGGEYLLQLYDYVTAGGLPRDISHGRKGD